LAAPNIDFMAVNVSMPARTDRIFTLHTDPTS
jgi:hypothetical protein